MEKEKIFRGFIQTSYSKLVRLFGRPLIENGKLSWIITVNDKEYLVYDFIPFESSQFCHKWRIDSEYKDLSNLEEYINSL